MAPPQGSVPRRHLFTCLLSTPRAWAKPFQVSPLSFFSRSTRLRKSLGSTPLW